MRVYVLLVRVSHAYGWHDHVYVWLVHRSLCGVGTCGCVFCWYIFATYIHRRPLTAAVAHHLCTYYIQLVDIFRYVGTYVALSYLVHIFYLAVAVAIAHNIHLGLLPSNTDLSNGDYRGTATANGNEET